MNENTEGDERKFLFVGGAMDHQWLPTEGASYWQVASSPPMTAFHGGNEPFTEMTETYRIEIIRTDLEEIAFYVLDTITTSQAIKRLVEGYNPNIPYL